MRLCNVVLYLALGWLFSATPVAANTLSHGAQLSLLTAGPGTELYSVFGHSALRVSDPLTGIDEVYNWGTFDFDTPNFYVKFTQGKLMYQLAVSSYAAFLRDYQHENRAVYEQELVLSPEEMQRIYNFLQINRLPENRDYLYDFFYDNCATRIRDLFDQELDLDWGEDPYPGPSRSFRDMLHPYTSPMPWAAFGIDLALGLPADKMATPWHYMFLPDEMFVAFAQARHSDGRQLVGNYFQVLPESGITAPKTLFTPTMATWLLLIIGLLTMFNKRLTVIFDRLFFSFLGIVGVLVLLLWFFSDHISTNQNMNLLWAVPTHLYFIFRAHRANMPVLVRNYFRVTAIVCTLLILFWWAIPQGYHAAFFPIVVLAGVRGWWVGRLAG